MQNISPALLGWFYRNRRTLPFRTDPTPYHIWVSEIMLQQTRVSAALPYYERFVRELPDIPALAQCEPERLHKLWEGLGYYSRVRNLQKAAQIVCRQYGGELPADYTALLSLPGIGAYTAGAIASIGFGLPVPAVDGNVLRVFSRLYNDDGDIADPTVKRRFTARVMNHQPPENAGDYNQALMELGALVCLPNGAPHCGECPLSSFCEGFRAGTVEDLPRKAPKKERKQIPVTVLLLHSPSGWLLEKRPEKGLLAGLWQPLLWEGVALTDETAVRQRAEEKGIFLSPDALLPLPSATHIFTHVQWNMTGWTAQVPEQIPPKGCVWAEKKALDETYPLPSAFKSYKKWIGESEEEGTSHQGKELAGDRQHEGNGDEHEEG